MDGTQAQQQWHEAIVEECQSILDNNTWTLLPRGQLPGQRKDSVCRLNKALYGLRQAPRCWNMRLNGWMVNQGFTRSLSDPCLYMRPAADGFMYVTVWVDDLLISTASLDDINSFK